MVGDNQALRRVGGPTSYMLCCVQIDDDDEDDDDDDAVDDIISVGQFIFGVPRAACLLFRVVRRKI